MNLITVLPWLSLLPSTLAYKFDPSDNKTLYNHELGVLYESLEQVHIYDTPAKIFYSRAYPNLCKSSILDQTFERVTCPTRNGEKYKERVYNSILHQCHHLWEKDIETLSKLFNSTETEIFRQRRHTGIVNNDFSDIYHPFYARSKRSITLSGLVLFSNLISNFGSIFSLAFSFFEHARVQKAIELQSRDLKVKISESNQVASSLFLESNIAISDLASAVCDTTLMSNNALLQITTLNLVKSNIKEIESEIFELGFGVIPKNKDFFDLIFKFCRNIKPNSRVFCNSLLWSGQIKIDFKGLILKNGIVQANMIISIPRESTNFKNNQLVKIINVGKFSEGSFQKLSVPNYAIRSEKEFIYGLDFSQCKNSFCPNEAVFVDNQVDCFTNILQNNTKNCISVTSQPPRCNFSQFRFGYLITASNAELIQHKISKRFIRNTSYILDEPATLICHHKNMRDTLHILDPKIIYETNERNLKIDFKILSFGNISNISSVDATEEKIKNRFQKLEASEDKININNKDISTLKVIITAGAISLISNLAIVFCFLKLDSIQKFFARHLNRLASRKAAKSLRQRTRTSLELQKREKLMNTLVRETVKTLAESNRYETSEALTHIELGGNGNTKLFQA